MALDSNEVRVGVTGAISLNSGTGLTPTDADTPLSTGWVDLGYASEDGVEETRNRSTQPIKAWQNADEVREVVTEASLVFKFALIQTNAETVGLYYGTTVQADGSVVIVPSQTGGRREMNLDVVDGAEFIRTYIASGEVTEVGSQVYKNGEPIGYQVTVKAYPDPSIVDSATGKMGSAIKWYSSLAV